MAPTMSPTTFLLVDSLANYTKEAIQQDPLSPQALAYHWLTQDPNADTYSRERLTQRFAMATIYYSTGGEK